MVQANNLTHNNHKQMKIRQANKFDLPYFLNLVHKIHEKKEIGTFDVELNDNYLNIMFTTAINGGGVVLIVEDIKPIGLMLGLISPNIWSEKTLMMNEILWYVEEEYRNTRAGYLLIKEYQEICEKLISEERIRFHTITTAKSMFDINLSRFGYDKIAETWISVEE
jgi:hypothetical protein